MDEIELKNLLLASPDEQLDMSMKELIEKMAVPFKSIEILEILDKCVHYAASSGFVINVLNVILNEVMKREGTTLEEIEKLAHWRTA